jgi:hypothetical protein
MTMSKKTTTPKTTKQNASKKAPRMSKSAARAEGAAKSERLRKAALAEIGERLAGGKQDHEVPTAKEVANSTHAATPAKAKRTKADQARQARAEGQAPSGLDLAAKALASAKEPLNSKAIVERVLAAGWKTSGKTPHATLYAAMIREIAAKGKDARFKKSDRGLFALNGKGA